MNSIQSEHLLERFDGVISPLIINLDSVGVIEFGFNHQRNSLNWQ